jgi:maleate isomerase
MPVYGSRGKVGVIDLSTCTALVAEFGLAVPPEVLVLYSRLRLPRGEVTVEALDEMLSGGRLEEAALELADAGVAAITVACTSATLLHGAGFDEQVSERVKRASGVPATTTATAVRLALRAVGARRASVGTPYDDQINERERAFLESEGISVQRIVGLSKRYDREIGELTLDDIRRLAHVAWEPGSDVLFLSCTNLPALTLIGQLESDLGRPVVTSNSATIWDLLHVGGCPPARAHSLGTLTSAGNSGVEPLPVAG